MAKRHAEKQLIKGIDEMLRLALANQLTQSDIQTLSYLKKRIEDIAIVISMQVDMSELSDEEFEKKYGMKKDGSPVPQEGQEEQA